MSFFFIKFSPPVPFEMEILWVFKGMHRVLGSLTYRRIIAQSDLIIVECKCIKIAGILRFPSSTQKINYHLELEVPH